MTEITQEPAILTQAEELQTPADDQQLAAPRTGLFASVYRFAVKILNRFNFGRTVLRALEEARLKLDDQHIKAQINQITQEGDTTVVSIDVLDELEDMQLCSLEIQCDTLDPELQPGQVIHNLT